ncbi:MAG: CDP-alcohol phosphatidyltransferase family protein [Syntrophales bacterium]
MDTSYREKQAGAGGFTVAILAPDRKGMLRVFGIPAVRRLVLICRQLGFEKIHIIGEADAFRPILSDIVSPEGFHSADGPGLMKEILEVIGFPDQKILLLKANCVVDRSILARFVKMRGGNGRLLIEARNHESGLPCVLDTEGKDEKRAEDMLMRAMAAQTEKDDGFLARHISRPASRFVSRKLALTPVTPNQITLVGGAIGLIGALLFSCTGYLPRLIGSLLFLFCVIMDGVDGEIARLKLQETSYGRHLDIITDNIVHVAVFFGIALGLYRGYGNPVYLLLLWLLLGGFALCGIAVHQCISKRGPDELHRSAKAIRIMALLSNRDFAYVLVVFAVIGRLQWFFAGAAVGTYLFATALWAVNYMEGAAARRSSGDHPGS